MLLVVIIISGVNIVVSMVGSEIIRLVVLVDVLRFLVIGVSRLIGSILVVIIENVVRFMVDIVYYGWWVMGVGCVGDDVFMG